ncbi:MAG: M48 family metallopeptidase [Candidatus Aureabacteria bacterium]|nr:M48 family metallopeptidase [Candidatus Auribacterota bacterium]
MWALIEKNKRNTFILITVFIVFMAALGYIFGYVYGNGYYGLAIGFTVALVTGIAVYYGGGSVVLGISGAKKIDKKDSPQLFNVVEEMAVASGLPMPEIYIIYDTAPNAFATGRNPAHAKIAVTLGLLQKLNRDELQGVVAHEMSHVKNYDILYATLVGVLVGSVALLCDFFLRYTFFSGGRRSRRDSKGGGGAQAVLMIIAIVLAVLAPIFAKLLQLAVSRQREYLADATGVQLTRNPLALAGALEKISGDTEVLEAANRATQHLYIVNPIKSFEARAKTTSLFSTHPPIQERISILKALAHQQ